MNLDQLLKHFENISEAEDAVPRLRRFIVDLAVRGKLLDQDTKDTPAAELLKSILVKKAELIGRGEIKKEKLTSAVNEAELPFGLPASWTWERLSNLTSYIQRGKSPQYSSGDGLPVVSQKCVRWDGLHLEFAKKITRLSLKGYEPIRFLCDGDLLWNSTGTGTIGRIIRVDNPPEKLVCDSHVTIVRRLLVNENFIRLWLSSDHVYGVIEDRAAGTTNQVELTAAIANNQITPVPPLAEQDRIVAKVDELMVLCDELEAARTRRETRRDHLVAATLHRLNNGNASPEAGNDPDFKQTARFYFNHLPRLTTRSEHIKQLRHAILSLALSGKLIPQDHNDEPADVLLSRIAEKRAKLLAQSYPNKSESKVQERKQLKQSLPRNLESLPHGWEWATLMQSASLVVDCHNKTAPYTKDGITILRTTNIRDGKLNLNEQKFVNDKTYMRWSARCRPEPGDILITREAPMGEACIIPDGMKVCMGQRMMLARFMRDEIDINFMLYSLRDPALMDRVQDKPVGATVQHLRVGGVETLLVPVPPLAEQHRIVAKVDELMELCDELEAQLATTATTRRQLLEATLHEALGPLRLVS